MGKISLIARPPFDENLWLKHCGPLEQLTEAGHTPIEVGQPLHRPPVSQPQESEERVSNMVQPIIRFELLIRPHKRVEETVQETGPEHPGNTPLSGWDRLKHSTGAVSAIKKANNRRRSRRWAAFAAVM